MSRASRKVVPSTFHVWQAEASLRILRILRIFGVLHSSLRTFQVTGWIAAVVLSMLTYSSPFALTESTLSLENSIAPHPQSANYYKSPKSHLYIYRYTKSNVQTRVLLTSRILPKLVSLLMKTAMMFAAPLELGGISSAAVESAVDAYANRVLETMSPTEAVIDASVGPYVTHLLRCAEIHDMEDLTSLSEFDSLLELLEDQCNMEEDSATDALKAIAKAVCTGIVPNETAGRNRSASFGLFGAAVTETRNRSASFGLYTGGGLDSFKSMKDSLEPVQTSDTTPKGKSEVPEPLLTDPFTPIQAGGPSPMKMEALVPVDLLGALDNPSPHISRIGGHAHFRQVFEQQHQLQQPDSMGQEEQLSNNEEAFPTLAAALSAPSNKKTDKSGRGKKGTTKKHSDHELAASLFRPARPRQNSLDEVVVSHVNSTSVPTASSNSQYFQQQLDSCIEILLSMNHDLSEDAARSSAMMSNADFNIAQYIVDAALSARPVCRHMLHDGCYRSDCQFSHDVEGHTCLFWLRGRCGKGSTCKFFHGFNKKLMEGLPTANSMTSAAHASMMSPQIPGSYPGSFGSTPTTSLAVTNGFVSSPLPTRGLHTNGFEPKQPTPNVNSFANIASQGYDHAKFTSPELERNFSTSSTANWPTVRIPQDLWNPHENRDASVFHIPDPIERYNKVSANVKRRDVVDLHFQSTKTFATVLAAILPVKLSELDEVWIVTGTGHHVGSKTHQKGGGALERAVNTWLMEEGYNCYKGRDRNGLGGALLVKR